MSLISDAGTIIKESRARRQLGQHGRFGDGQIAKKSVSILDNGGDAK